MTLFSDERYTLLSEAKGWLGGPRTQLGTKGVCRYCGESNLSRFRTTAHTIPEFLGNKWIVSLDECDTCNGLFSTYDDALAAFARPYLTLGGVKGKKNKIPKTGRSDGQSTLERRENRDGSGSLMLSQQSKFGNIWLNPDLGKLRINSPVAAVPFKPRYAYKCLAKIGFALLPHDEVKNYQKLRSWLLDKDDRCDFPCLSVGISVSPTANAAQLVAATLLRRRNPAELVPHLLFSLRTGAICWQIDLMSDHLEDHLAPMQMDAIKIQWSSLICSEDRAEVFRIDYGEPVHYNWCQNKPTPPPLEALVLELDTQTWAGQLSPTFRNQ